jgi:hypothetical protein
MQMVITKLLVNQNFVLQKFIMFKTKNYEEHYCEKPLQQNIYKNIFNGYAGCSYF